MSLTRKQREDGELWNIMVGPPGGFRQQRDK